MKKYNPTPHEIARDYPAAIPYIKNKVKEIKKEINLRKNLFYKLRDESLNLHRIIADQEDYVMFWSELYINIPVKKLESKLKPLERILIAKDNKNYGQDINRAKAHEIGEFLDFKRGKVRCLWHEEKTGSLHYYPKTNSVHCFGCGKSADVIDVVRQLYNYSFREAVNFLNK